MHVLRQDRLHWALAFHENPQYTINTVIRIVRNGFELRYNDPIWPLQDSMILYVCVCLLFDVIFVVAEGLEHVNMRTVFFRCDMLEFRILQQLHNR